MTRLKLTICPDIEFYECLDCGEQVYDAQAIREIERNLMESFV